MTKARQKVVRKVNETRIKVRETNGDHLGYIEWIEKFDFGNLLVEDRRTNDEGEERLKIFAKSPTEMPRLGFSSRKQFSTLILSDYKVPEGLIPFLLHSSPYL